MHQQHGLKFPEGLEPPEGVVVYDENGVDLTLIRYMLSLTLEQRLQHVQDCANQILSMRDERPEN
jgi:hypothetical protein